MLEIIRKRRSIRKYLSRDVEQKQLDEILKAAMFSPSARGCRSWEFIVVKDRKTIEKLSLVKEGANFAKDAPLVIILAADETGDPRWVENLSIAAAYIYLETTNQGLGTCFVQIRAKPDDLETTYEDYVKEIISAPKNIRILCLMPLGYPAEEKKGHQDSEFNPSKIHREKW